MGEVWRADHRLLARPAAIKLIKPEMIGGGDPVAAHDFMRSFEREAQITAGLRSTHTVVLYDFGMTADGAFYYVMELLDGRDLHTLVKDFGPLDPARVANLLEQVCDSLAEAHEKGLVHRDIKPANIQVCRMGTRYDFVKVLDFGLARAHTRRGASSPERESAITVIGTPSYVAPETATGDAVDARADLYSLGCVAYWLLTGRPVFDASTSAELVLMHVEREVEPVSARAEQQIPPELEAIVLSCLEKNPDDRPQSAEDLARRLSETGLAEQWTQRRARDWWQTNTDQAG